MGEYKTDSGPIDTLRKHLEAMRTESAHIEPKTLRAAVLDARERLAHRPRSLPTPLPERIAALQSEVMTRLDEMERTLKPPREQQSADSSACMGYLAVAYAFYDICLEATDLDDQSFWYTLHIAALHGFEDCSGVRHLSIG
jgi:hypothetical protein